MSKELSVLVAAYDDSDNAQQGYSVLKEELPKTGLVMDRSKVLVLATSDAPNEIGVEHTGGGPIGMVVEHKAGQALKGRLAPGTGMIDPAVEGQASAAVAHARGRAIVPVERDGGDDETRKEAIQAAVGMAMALAMEQWVHPSASASALRSLAAANQE